MRNHPYGTSNLWQARFGDIQNSVKLHLKIKEEFKHVSNAIIMT